MKTTTLILLAALTGILRAQGPLTPPGLPEPTMKTLDQIEPRTPIYSLPYTISQSGSYYFTGNLEFSDPSGDAITITASNVTLDLMGFTLSSTPGVIGYGIHLASPFIVGVTIQNGTIAGNTTVTTSGSPRVWSVTAAGFVCGILDSSSHSSFRNLTVKGARDSGISSNNFTTLDNIRAEQNGLHGIYSPNGSSISNSTVSYNGGSGIAVYECSITNVTASYNGGSGITAVASSIANSTGFYNGVSGISADLSTVTSSSGSYNPGSGIVANEGNVLNCTARYNGAGGIGAGYGSVANSTAHHNSGSGGIVASLGSVTNSTAANNDGPGITANDGSVTHSVAILNTDEDIFAPNSAVAFCRFVTSDLTGSTRTGNYPSP